MFKQVLSSSILATALIANASLAELAVSDSWIRAMPPTQKMTAAYGTVTNNGSEPVTINGASAEFAHMAELHTTIHENGSARMEPLGDIALKPGESFTFKPNGPHVMIMGVTTMPAEGTEATFCFTTTGGESACSTAPVTRGAPGGHHQH